MPTIPRSSALALLSGSVIAGVQPAGAQAALPTVRIGSDPIDSFGEAYFGDERGIFRDNGVNVAISTFPNGATIVQGVISGDLDAGTVAAATIAEPSLSDALHNGEVRTFANVYAVIAPEFANIVWFASKAWLQKNPDTAKKLVAGIYATARWSNAHQADTAPIIARIAKLDAGAVAGMTRAYFATTGDPKYVQAPLDFSYRYGLISRALTTAEFIAPI